MTTVPATKMIFQFLSTNGDGTGTTNANGDYSDTGLGLTEFYIQPPAGQVFEIHRMIIQIQDAGTFDAEKYGNNITLTNGITVKVTQGGKTGASLAMLTNGLPITQNAQWGKYCFDVDVKTWGVGDEILVSRWTFAKSGSPILLRGSLKQCLVVTLNDDLDALVSHTFNVQGKIVSG